jgi:aldehyde dehydrogenase (NAD+)
MIAEKDADLILHDTSKDDRTSMTSTTIQHSVSSDLISTTVARLRQNFNVGLTRTYTYRQQQLAGMARFLKECEEEIKSALLADLGKPAAETLIAEIAITTLDLKHAQKNLAAWMKRKKVSTALIAQPGVSYIYPEPLGVALIIAPWNYPVQLTLAPLIGALAAGNCVVLKPSEVAPATSHLLATVLPKYIDSACLAVFEGGVPETTALLAEHFDHIFYTGSGTVGRVVMTAAAKNLTPVTLELGGKSPCIVDASTNLDVAVRRIIWAKFSNAGQTCIAPDYILVDAAIADSLLEKMKITLGDFYGDNPASSKDYGRIINSHHYQRLINLLSGSGDIYLGGNGDEAERYLAPTILRNVPDNAPIMADEIFGPILPVININNIDEAIAFINARPKPLALYLFSSDQSICERVIANTSSGSVAINYPMMQVTNPELPFGGVGASGMGAYHGKASFDTFTHFKSVLKKPTWIDLAMMYPPYSTTFTRLIRWLMR